MALALLLRARITRKELFRLEPQGMRAAAGADAATGRAPGGYPVIDGPHYYDVLGELHAILRPRWYLEIGTARGYSLKRCPGDFVAIDPAFDLRVIPQTGWTTGHLRRQTSDDFFASGFLEAQGIVPEFGFLDGLHQFEALLRDFMQFERRAAPGAVAILHDCLPFDHKMEERTWDTRKTQNWTGDVWKAVVALLDHRPDLRIGVLDAWPTGLVVIEGLDPASRALDAAYDAFVARMLPVRLRDYGVDAYFGRFAIAASHRYLDDMRRRRADPNGS
jgi:hypothetical protein